MEKHITKLESTTCTYGFLQELRQQVRYKLASLIGTSTTYSQPLYYLNYAFNPKIPIAKAKLIAGLGNFLMELEVLCSTLGEKESCFCPLKLVSKEEYLQRKQNADNHFSTFFEGNCFYGRHAIYINDFNPYDIYYVYVPTIEDVIEECKNLGNMN